MDKKQKFNEEIYPIITSLRAACNAVGVPMFCSCIIPGEGKRSEECISEMVSPGVIGCTVKDDKIADFVKVLNGFQVTPPSEVLEVEIG